MKIQNYQNLHLNFNSKTNKTDKKSIPQNGLHFTCKLKKTQVYPLESDTKLKFKENNSQQFTLPCNVNHRKYVTSQSNGVTAMSDRKSHMAVSHGQNLCHTGENVRKVY
jgi:hypothetical protein